MICLIRRIYMFFIPEDCNNEYVKEIAIKLLQHIISTKQFITYGQLSLKMSFDINPRIIERPLGRISYACINNGLPPISAMVVNQETQMPGKGFFNEYCREIKQKDTQELEWIRLVKKITDYESWTDVLVAFENIK